MAALLGLSGYDTGSDHESDDGEPSSKKTEQVPSAFGNVTIGAPQDVNAPEKTEEIESINNSLVSAYSVMSGDDQSGKEESDDDDHLLGARRNAVNVENLPPPDPATAVFKSNAEKPVGPVHYPTPSPFREAKEGEGTILMSEPPDELKSMLDELGEEPSINKEKELESFLQISAEEEAVYASLTYLQELPKDPEEECTPELQQRIKEYLKLAREKGYNLTANLKRKKEFGNPQILQKVVDFFSIDDIESNYPPELFSPHGYSHEHYYDELVLAQRRAQQAKQTAHRNAMLQHQQMKDRMEQVNNSQLEKKAKRASKWGTAPAQPNPNPQPGMQMPPPGYMPPPGTGSGNFAMQSAFQQQEHLESSLLLNQAAFTHWETNLGINQMLAAQQSHGMGMLGNGPMPLQMNPYMPQPGGGIPSHLMNAVAQLQGNLGGPSSQQVGAAANLMAQQHAASISAQLKMQTAAALANASKVQPASQLEEELNAIYAHAAGIKQVQPASQLEEELNAIYAHAAGIKQVNEMGAVSSKK